MVNEIWDTGQLGAVEGVLGTVDQLIIDRCIMEEAKEYHRNLAVAFYDYKKAYDKVHHDWMTRVYKWIGIGIECGAFNFGVDEEMEDTVRDMDWKRKSDK